MPDSHADADGPDGSQLAAGWRATPSGTVEYETDVDWKWDNPDTPLACGVENPEVCDSCQ